MSDGVRPRATDSALPGNGEDSNIVELVSRLSQQGAHLAREQVNLLQAEVREAAQELKAAIIAMAVAAVVGVAGLGVLLMGIAYYVADALDNQALGTTLVGAATLGIALALYLGGRKKVDATHLAPDRSIETIQDTSVVATGDLHHTGVR